MMKLSELDLTDYHFNQDIRHCYLAVPDSFDDNQLSGVKAAAEHGGLSVIGYISNTQACLLGAQ